MKPICLALVALAGLAPAGQAQTGYSYTELIPWIPLWWVPSFTSVLYGRAYTSSGAFASLAAGPAGEVYAGDGGAVWKITAQGDMVPVTGFGYASVLPGERISALLATPPQYDLAADSQGNLFIAGGSAIYRVTPGGLIEYYSAVPAWALATGPGGNLYAVVNGNQVVRVASDGSGVVVAGSGQTGCSGDGGPAAAAQLSASRIAADAAGNLWIADSQNNRIRKVDPGGIITTAVEAPSPFAIAAGPGGAIYYSQAAANPQNGGALVRRLDAGGTIVTVAGAANSPVSYGDGGPAAAASLASAASLTVDSAGNLYIADFSRLRRVDTAGIIRSVAGCECYGDGVPAPWAQVAQPYGMAVDSAGNAYFSDRGSHMVRRIAADGTVTTVAGNGEPGYTGDGGLATQARLSGPAGLALDAAGNLYIADRQNSVIRRVGASGIIQTAAGNGVAAFTGDGGLATAASLSMPEGVAVDAAGSLYIADTLNSRIRKVDSGGTIRTVAGTSQSGASGDGGPAALAQLINPRALAFDQAGNLLLTDSSARMVRRITPAGIIQRVAGTGQEGRGGDGSPAVAANLDLPWGIAVDSSGTIFFSDGNAVRSVDTSGIIRTVSSAFAYGVAAGTGSNIWLATGHTVAVLSPVGPPFALGPLIANQSIRNAAITANYLGFQVVRNASAAIAPGEFIIIPGTRLGPGIQVTASPSATTLAGVRVLFDGIAAPVLSVSSSQVTAIAPYGIAGKATVGVVVEVDGVSSNVARMAVLPAVPALFVYTYGTLAVAAANNPNGTVNGPGNPAAAGSTISLFACGAGEMTPPATDGGIVPGSPLPRASLPVSVTMSTSKGTVPVEVLYAGGAPGYVSGLLQVNVRLPANLAPEPLSGLAGYYLYTTQVTVGNGKSELAEVFVNP